MWKYGNEFSTGGKSEYIAPGYFTLCLNSSRHFTNSLSDSAKPKILTKLLSRSENVKEDVNKPGPMWEYFLFSKMLVRITLVIPVFVPTSQFTCALALIQGAPGGTADRLMRPQFSPFHYTLI